MIDLADLDLLRTLPERIGGELSNADLQLIKRIRRDGLLARTRIAVLENEIVRLRESSK